jgi:hypothetical protein
MAEKKKVLEKVQYYHFDVWIWTKRDHRLNLLEHFWDAERKQLLEEIKHQSVEIKKEDVLQYCSYQHDKKAHTLVLTLGFLDGGKIKTGATMNLDILKNNNVILEVKIINSRFFKTKTYQDMIHELQVVKFNTIKKSKYDKFKEVLSLNKNIKAKEKKEESLKPVKRKRPTSDEFGGNDWY